MLSGPALMALSWSRFMPQGSWLKAHGQENVGVGSTKPQARAPIFSWTWASSHEAWSMSHELWAMSNEPLTINNPLIDYISIPSFQKKTCPSLRAKFLHACCLMRDACCLMSLMPGACLLAVWCLNTCQTHPQRVPQRGGGRKPHPFVDGFGRCSSIKQQASIKHWAASTTQQAFRNWAIRLWQENTKKEPKIIF